MKLCLDAGPLENTHRGRGIGTFTRSLLRMLEPDLLDRFGVEATFLKRTPLEAADGSLPAATWVRRPPRAAWTAARGNHMAALAEYWKCIETAAKLPGEIAVADPDVFFTPDPRGIAISSRFKTVATLYDLIPLVFPDRYLPARAVLRRIAYRFELSSARHATHLIAISEATRRDAVRLLGLPPSSISVVHLGVDAAVFNAVEYDVARAAVMERFGLGRPYFLYVGGFDARKNVEALIDAFLRLAETETGVDLVIVGALDGPGERLRQAVALRAGGERIRWLGFVAVEDLPALYAGSRALVFPSLYEGFGLPVLEAMSCGAAVVTLSNSSLPEIAGDAAIYADSARPEALAASMRRICRDSVLAAELRDRGHERAANFTWRRTAEGVLEVCRAVGAGEQPAF